MRRVPALPMRKWLSFTCTLLVVYTTVGCDRRVSTGYVDAPGLGLGEIVVTSEVKTVAISTRLH